ncbi:MAG: septal ring lytic transglycosylase RlpA family protein [Treponema sp.]|nr:septal ring lytic transglycosylase RlpA family protein [Treponema sp.]
MNKKLLTLIAVVLFAATACFTACMTTTNQTGVSSEAKGPSVVSSVALIPFWGPDKTINDQFEKEVYAAVKKMKGFNPVSVNTADIPIPYEIPAPSLIGGYDCALTGELRQDSDDDEYWHLTLYLWKEKRLIFSDQVSGYDREEIAEGLPFTLGWLFAWIPRGESPARKATVSPEAPARRATVSVALVPFWGSDQPPQRQPLNQRGNATVELVANGLSAAHPALPIGSMARVLNIANSKEIEVTIVGRINPDTTRVIDLSPGAARALNIGFGGPVIINQILPVRVRPATEPSPSVPISVSIIEQFGAELYTAVGNMKDFRPVRIDMTNLPDDVPEGGYPPFICPSPSLITTNPLALTGEVTRNDTGSLNLRLYLWEMTDKRLVFTSKLTARNMNEYKLLLPGLLEKLFSQLAPVRE